MQERFPRPDEPARRSFLKSAAFAGVGAAVAPALGRAAEAKPAALPATDFAFEEATIETLARRMASGELTARKLTQAYLDRIEALDHRGPELRQVIETNLEALALADSLDAERRGGRVRGPLHGIPVLLKDNVDTADKMTTTAGSLALQGSIPPRDAFLAARLRAAGAILLGKANMSEWANIRSTRSTSGWSARGGQAKNPYALDRNTCGSSSGSGGGVSANLCAVAIGTETDGSIVCPSSACGLVGVKPTLGLVSRAGVIPIAHSQDTAGPMTRTVRDAAVLLSALTGEDPRDPKTVESRGKAHTDYTKSLDVGGLKGARLGVARKFFGTDPRVDRLMEDALAEMRRLGAETIDVELSKGNEYEESELEVLLYELKADLNAYLATLGPQARVKTLADVIAFNEAHRAEEMPYFGQELFLRAQEKGDLTTPAYKEALARNLRLSQAEGIDAVVAKDRLDALVGPTGGPAWLTDLVGGDHYTGIGCSTPPAVAGYPHVTVPAGFVFGLPVGISFFGKAWSEPTLLRNAYAFEQATHHRKPPRLLPTVDLSTLS